VPISECGCRPGVKVLDDGVRDGKVAMVTSAYQDILLAGIVPLHTLSSRIACSDVALVQSARIVCKSLVDQMHSWAVSNGAWAAPCSSDTG
jgi:hypothetical protein